MHHFVYWLFDSQTEELLYIGRSHDPVRRKRDFERVHNRRVRSGLCNRYNSLSSAQTHELHLIRKHRPPYNKKETSSPTSLGMKRQPPSDETRARMRAAKLGKKLTDEHKRSISRASLGNQHRLGDKHSDETRARMSASHRMRLKVINSSTKE